MRDEQFPRPLLRRAAWESLDGSWAFAADPGSEWEHPAQVEFDTHIEVPFSPETARSGVAWTGDLNRCWYRRAWRMPADRRSDPDQGNGQRVILHFGGVDWAARVWVNGDMVGSHEGGYTPFAVDITHSVPEGGELDIVVRADDFSRRRDLPRGKQDWTSAPHEIWYTRTTGIWQTVWLEYTPRTSVTRLDWTSDLDGPSVTLCAEVEGDPRPGDHLRVQLFLGERRLVDDQIAVTEVSDRRARVRRTFDLAFAVEEDHRELFWSPERPTLLDATIDYVGGDGTDSVESYVGIRSVASEGGHLWLNGELLTLRTALDQGYWPDSGLTAPDVAALRRDVELVKELGLNGVRKHQKIEDPRWLAFCDELGVLVWEELPSTHEFSPSAVVAWTTEWMRVIARDRSHPSIIGWVPVNEGWGLPDLMHDEQQRAALRALTELTRALDPDRLISANDGWQTSGGDVIGIHDYGQDAATLTARYASAESVRELFGPLGPAIHALTLDGFDPQARALVVSELGGISLAEDAPDAYGYGNAPTTDAWLEQIRGLCRAVLYSPVLSGYCWTQLTDTYQETNGLVRMDRTPKAPVARLRAALVGWRLPAEKT
jgi:beta-galactosidase/beta-glucuronidase